MSRSVAIVGSGPSGFYAADGLRRKLPGCRIDIIDRLPTPFGLVRGGVAPDHQSTKAVQRVFERTATAEGVRFLGHVDVGRDVSLAELRSSYDAVVIATGCPVDRRLGIPGEHLAGVYGSWAFVAWYNGHPRYRDLDPALPGPAVAVIGNGNVAIDCVRVLAKTPAEMAKADLCGHAAERIAAMPLTTLYLVGRRGPVQASYTPVELAELGQLERCAPVVDAAALERDIAAADPSEVKAKEKMLDTLRALAAIGPDDRPVKLHLLFWSAPRAILGTDRAAGVRLERARRPDGGFGATGETYDIAAQTVISAIGYVAEPLDNLPMDPQRGIAVNDRGRIEPGLYVVGWLKRGPSGTIPTNRADSLTVVELIAADLAAAGPDKPGPAALDRLLAERGARPVSFADWQRINEAEIKRAASGRPREKITRVDEMLAVCHGAGGAS